MSLRRSLFALALSLLAASTAAGAVRAERSAQSDAYFQRAMASLDADNYDMGARLLYQAAQLSPNDYYIQYNLGISFMRLKRYREGWQALAKASQLKPNDVDTQLALAHAYAECGDPKNCVTIVQNLQKKVALNADQSERAASLLGHYGGGDGASTQAIAQIAGRQPRSAEMHRTLGYSYIKAGKFKEAAGEYQAWVKLEPNSPDALKGLMSCQNRMGDLEGMQVSRKLFVAKFPNDKETKTILDEIAYYEKDFARTRKREANAATSDDEGAFASIRMPVKVFVHDRLSGRTTWSAQANKNAKGKVNYSLMVERALDQWCSASGRRLTFIVIDNPQNANIECQWTPDRAKLHYSFAAGVTSYSQNQAHEPKATIYLLSDCDDENGFLDVALHELGHAIGLSHSSSPADVMYSSGQILPKGQAPSLSANDIARMKRLYK